MDLYRVVDHTFALKFLVVPGLVAFLAFAVGKRTLNRIASLLLSLGTIAYSLIPAATRVAGGFSYQTAAKSFIVVAIFLIAGFFAVRFKPYGNRESRPMDMVAVTITASIAFFGLFVSFLSGMCCS